MGSEMCIRDSLIFGAKGYGQRQGLLMVPARLVQAAAPFLFGMAVERWGDGALWFSAGLALSACLALVAMTGHRWPHRVR